jgi:hypothetical protein
MFFRMTPTAQRPPNDNVAARMRKGQAFRLVTWVDGSDRFSAV